MFVCFFFVVFFVFEGVITSVLIPPPSPLQVFDWQQERPGAEGQSDEGLNLVREGEMRDCGEWVTVTARHVQEADLEPLDYDLDISREVRDQGRAQTLRGPGAPVENNANAVLFDCLVFLNPGCQLKPNHTKIE